LSEGLLYLIGSAENKNRPNMTGSINRTDKIFEKVTTSCNAKDTDGGGPPSALLCQRHVPLSERSMPHLCLLRINVQAGKNIIDLVE